MSLYCEHLLCFQYAEVCPTCKQRLCTTHHACRPAVQTLSASLAGVTLRKVQPNERKTQPAPKAMSLPPKEKYRESVMDANVESWLEPLKDHTFLTELVPITPANGKLLVDGYYAYEAFQKQCSVQGIPAVGFKLPAAIADQAAVMEAELQAVIDRVRRHRDDPVFVKASSRSPKDAPTSQARLENEYVSLLRGGRQRGVQGDNLKVHCMLQAGLSLLQIMSAKEVLELFFRSERICQDMELALENVERWKEHFVVRRWIPIDVGMEFRGFVFDGELRALSQYNYVCLFPYVVAQKDKILQKIIAFFKIVKPKLQPPFRDYVIDFALVEAEGQATSVLSAMEGKGPDVDKMDALVIELNPFLESTDGCLFSWQKERPILEKGPFEFRVLTEPLKGVKNKISHDWRRLMELEP